MAACRVSACLRARTFLRHVQHKGQDALGLLLAVEQGLVNEVDVARLGLAGGGVVQHGHGFGARKRLAGGVHLVEQGNEALLLHLGQDLGYGAAEHGAAGGQGLVALVEKPRSGARGP